MAIKKSITSTTGYRNALGQFSKAPKLAVAGATLTRLPLTLAAGLAAVPIAGLLSIVGGTMSLAGGAISTANTVARAGLLATSGVMRATGGLTGGGKSGNVKKERQIQMIKSTLNKKDATGRDRSSTGLADVQSTLADFDIPEGSMSMLPTGNEDGMGMLSGMLHQIAVNTSYLGGIDSKIDALVGLSSISVIDQAQEDRGDGPPGEKQDGFIKRSYNSLKDNFSKISSGLGGAAKNILKGLGLIGGLIAFKKFEPQITSGIASLFENVSGFFDSMSSGSDPSDGIVDYFDNMMENTILPALTSMAVKALEVIFKGIKIALNQFLPSWAQIDIQTASSGMGESQTQSQVATKSIASTGADLGNVTGYGEVLGKNIRLGNMIPGTGGKGDVLPGMESKNVEQAVRDRLEFMYNVFMKSGGRVRWTEIGKGFKPGGGIDSLNGTFSVSDILYKSQPIVDGFVKPRGSVDFKNLPTPTLTGSDLDEYIRSSVAMSKAKQVILDDPGFINSTFFQGPTMGEKFLFMDENMGDNEAIKSFTENLEKRKLLLNDDGASLGNGQGEITAAIDASHNSQHLHETTVAGLTSVYHSDLNMPAFMGHNQVA